jgi:NAD dependent epimerase/dehydratase family enzyme
MKPIVIAGGSGFLGQILAQYFLRAGWKVVVLTRTPTTTPSGGNVREIGWDGRTLGEWGRELEGASALINLAGRSVDSWIHELDFCRAVERLIAHSDFSGAVNVAAPNPIPNQELMRTLREVCGVPFGLPAPGWMLELGAFFLRTETELIIKSRRVVPGRLLAAGFKFQFEQIRQALEALTAGRRIRPFPRSTRAGRR